MDQKAAVLTCGALIVTLILGACAAQDNTKTADAAPAGQPVKKVIAVGSRIPQDPTVSRPDVRTGTLDAIPH